MRTAKAWLMCSLMMLMSIPAFADGKKSHMSCVNLSLQVVNAQSKKRLRVMITNIADRPLRIVSLDQGDDTNIHVKYYIRTLDGKILAFLNTPPPPPPPGILASDLSISVLKPHETNACEFDLPGLPLGQELVIRVIIDDNWLSSVTVGGLPKGVYLVNVSKEIKLKL